jgi:hypothetical protein
MSALFLLRSVQHSSIHRLLLAAKTLQTEFDALKDREGYRQRANGNLER